MVEMKKCNNNCGREIPDDSPHKSCEHCRTSKKLWHERNRSGGRCSKTYDDKFKIGKYKVF